MLNSIINSKVIYDDNVININTEKLYREAEDCFFYFNRYKKAIEKLNEAIELTPAHTKCLKLRGDIHYSLGNTKKALEDYTSAAALKPNDAVLLASISSLYEILGKYELALAFCEDAMSKLNIHNNHIFSQLCELKISILISMQRYAEAESCLDFTKKRFSPEELYGLGTHQYSFLKKKLELIEKINNLSLKIV